MNGYFLHCVAPEMFIEVGEGAFALLQSFDEGENFLPAQVAVVFLRRSPPAGPSRHRSDCAIRCIGCYQVGERDAVFGYGALFGFAHLGYGV